jgi:chitinase
VTLLFLRSGSRTLKVLLSVGGWTYSQDGHFAFVTNPTLRATFIASAIQLIKDYGFDGMCVVSFLFSDLLRFDVCRPHRSDIDFEYPSGTAQSRTFANLLTELRSALNALAKSNGDSVPFQLTVSAFFDATVLF